MIRSGKVKALIATVLILILVIVIKLSSTTTKQITFEEVQNRWQSFISKTESKKEELFIEDIDYLVKYLEKNHYDMYHTISASEFSNETLKLKESIRGTSDIEKLISLKGLVTKIGDGHTNLSIIMPMHYFPIKLTRFKDGIYVMSCGEEYSNILGSKLVSINGKPVERVIDSFKDFIAYDNEISLDLMGIMYLSNADYLNFYNVINNNTQALFEFITPDGTTTEVNIKSLDHKPKDYQSISSVYSKADDLLYMQRDKGYYWFEYFPENNMVYFNYNSCRDDKSRPINKFIEELLDFINENKVEKLVFDLRSNGGGNSTLIMPLIDALSDNELINKEGNLYVVTGRHTFSSGVLNTMYLKQYTNAILIGEATGGSPNHYGEVKRVMLPNSGMPVNYSTKYFKRTEQDTNTISPDIIVEYCFNDYINGIDPVMVRILNNLEQD